MSIILFIYRSNSISIGNAVTLNKPFLYKHVFISSRDKVTYYELMNSYFSFQSSVKFNKGAFVILNFSHLFYNKTANIILKYKKKYSALEIQAYQDFTKQNKKKYNCIYSIQVNKDFFTIQGLNQSKSISFDIYANDKTLYSNLLKDICSK